MAVFDDILYLHNNSTSSHRGDFFSQEYDSFAELQPFKKTWDDQNARKNRKKRNLCGLEKFDLKYVPRNSGFGSDCLAREIYCFNRFREEGLPAAYANLVTLTLANPTSSYESYYELIEPIDKEFLKKRFGKEEAKGDLYKCVYNGMGKADLSREGAVAKNETDGHSSGERIARGKIGVENNYEYYVPCYQLKTNDDLGEDSDFSKMANFIHAMWDLNYGKGTQDLLEQTLDVDEFLRFSALSYLLCNFDDQRYNYNNYYLYFLPSNCKAIYIPYDWDWSLGYTPSGDSDVVTSAPLEEVTLDGNRPANVYYATIFNSNNNTQYSRKQYQDDYLSYVSEYAPRTLDINAFESLISTLGCSNIEVSQVRHYFEVKAAKI